MCLYAYDMVQRIIKGLILTLEDGLPKKMTG